MTRNVTSDRTALGIGIILASVLTMAFADAVVKLVSADLTIWQVFLLRSLVAVPVLVAILRLTGVSLRPAAPVWVIIRSVLLVLTWLGFYAALPVLSLSVAAVAVYTNPIMIALLSAALIGESVSARQWGGVLLGFFGVCAILRPGTNAFSWFTLLPLLGVLSAAYFVGVARAYQIAPPPVIATFDYAYLLSAALWGFVFFAEQPDLLTVAGMVLITAAGLLVTASSARKYRRRTKLPD